MKFLVAMFLFVISMVTFGQVIEPPMPPSDFFEILIQSLGGLKGASKLAIAGIVVKVLLAFANSELFGKAFSKIKGSMKLIIVLALSLVAGVIALMSEGMELSAALMHSTTMSAFLVLVNQIYKQFFEKED